MLDHTSQIVFNLSSTNPHFQNEATCKTSCKEMIFIWTRIENYFQIKDFALTVWYPSPLRSCSARVTQARRGACVTPARVAVKETGASPEATEAVYLIIEISLTNWSFP